MSPVKDLVYRNRSYRRFHQDQAISLDILKELADLGRMSACGANQQPLKYILSADPGKNASVFPHLCWAKNLPEWKGPVEGERPAAYIVIVGDRTISESFGQDHGIAAQSIMLGAAERGLGGCMIANIDKPGLRAALELDGRYELLLVLALGKPRETVVVDELDPGGNPDYWRDDKQVHHLPKRRLQDIILAEYD
ncbi:MAG: nitroreductase family protein [Candidatus Edwardsbacteria bacterium]|jgi:nitroreductase|nr:nitroreductase family protein [Candidatus Edwardsbacteria bacterium]